MPESLLIRGLIGGFFLAAPLWLLFMYWTRDTNPAKKEIKKHYMHGGACPICEDGSLVSAALLEGVVQCTRCSWDSMSLNSEIEDQSEWHRCKMIDWRSKAHELEEQLKQREELVKDHWAKIKSLEDDKQHIIREADKQYAGLEKELEEAKAGRLELANIVQKDTSKLSNASNKIAELEEYLSQQTIDTITKLSLKPDDILVIRSENPVPFEVLNSIKACIHNFMEVKIPVFLLNRDVEIKTITNEYKEGHDKLREGLVEVLPLLENLDLFIADHLNSGATGTQLFDFCTKNKLGWCLGKLQALVPKEKSKD